MSPWRCPLHRADLKQCMDTRCWWWWQQWLLLSQEFRNYWFARKHGVRPSRQRRDKFDQRWRDVQEIVERAAA